MCILVHLQIEKAISVKSYDLIFIISKNDAFVQCDCFSSIKMLFLSFLHIWHFKRTERPIFFLISPLKRLIDLVSLQLILKCSNLFKSALWCHGIYFRLLLSFPYKCTCQWPTLILIILKINFQNTPTFNHKHALFGKKSIRANTFSIPVLWIGKSSIRISPVENSKEFIKNNNKEYPRNIPASFSWQY